MDPLYLAIEIGGTKLQMVTGDAAGAFVDRQRLQVNVAAGAAGIRQQIAENLPALVKRWKPQAIAVGFGGPVDWKSGRIARSHQIAGWSDFDLTGWLRTNGGGMAIVVDNDANMAALGEASRGAGRGANPVFYVTLGSGVGGGLVVDGRIYHGARPGESEIGHIRLDREGTIVEERCSGWAVDAKIRALKSRGDRGALAELTRELTQGEARFLGQALAQGDPAARQILKETAEDLAFGLSHAVHLMHPERIILGGGLSLVGEPLRAAVASALPKFIMEVFRAGPQVCLAALGEDAVPTGCLVAAGCGLGQ